MTFGYRRRHVCLNSLLSGLFIIDISCHLAIFLLIFSNSSTSQKDKYVLLHFFKIIIIIIIIFFFFITKKKENAHNVSAFKDQLGEIKLA